MIRETIADCAICALPVDRNANHAEGLDTEGEPVTVCNHCLTDYDDEELAERGVMINE